MLGRIVIEGAIPMGGVFISYRREDSQGEALHLFDDLKEHFGIDRIFMDVTGIDPGKDFRKVIENAVTTCDVLIVMIGKKWIDAVDEEGKRRLDDPKDLVRIETAAALHRDVPVIPALVQGAEMPRPEKLPAEIEALAWRNAFELRHNRWSIDVAELVTALRKIVPGSSTLSSAENKSQRWWQNLPRSLVGLAGIIGAVIALVALYVEWPQITQTKIGPADGCMPPYVWRLAVPSDYVCVTQESRKQVELENQRAAERRQASGGAFGPDTCQAGYVWREAFEGDTVCVLPERREEVRKENAGRP